MRGPWVLGSSCCRQHRSRLNDRFAFTGLSLPLPLSFEHAQSVRSHEKTHRFFFGPELEWNRINLDRFCARMTAHQRHISLSFYLPPSVDLLLTILGQIFCSRDRAREAPFALFYLPPSVGLLEQSMECAPDCFCSHFSSEHQFVRLQKNNVFKIFLFARSRSSIGATNSLAFKEPM